jgi:hypothetical protein
MVQSERGLYETLVTEAMDAHLAALGGAAAGPAFGVA